MVSPPKKQALWSSERRKVLFGLPAFVLVEETQGYQSPD